jgi:hypothetical protein
MNNVFGKVIDPLVANYGTMKAKEGASTKAIMKNWQESLKGYSDEILELAVKNFIADDEKGFFPRIGQIKKLCDEIKGNLYASEQGKREENPKTNIPKEFQGAFFEFINYLHEYQVVFFRCLPKENFAKRYIEKLNHGELVSKISIQRKLNRNYKELADTKPEIIHKYKDFIRKSEVNRWFIGWFFTGKSKNNSVLHKNTNDNQDSFNFEEVA